MHCVRSSYSSLSCIMMTSRWGRAFGSHWTYDHCLRQNRRSTHQLSNFPTEFSLSLSLSVTQRLLSQTTYSRQLVSWRDDPRPSLNDAAIGASRSSKQAPPAPRGHSLQSVCAVRMSEHAVRLSPRLRPNTMGRYNMLASVLDGWSLLYSLHVYSRTTTDGCGGCKENAWLRRRYRNVRFVCKSVLTFYLCMHLGTEHDVEC